MKKILIFLIFITIFISCNPKYNLSKKVEETYPECDYRFCPGWSFLILRDKDGNIRYINGSFLGKEITEDIILLKKQ